ncbi:MAG: DoxX family membrane protein [Nitrospinaceae bacterium]|nr:DoxX family protein [Nitrospinaceae bacterium]NIR55258.1 DoxX family protein [Nitrospinaceae bacterium]NIS85696.1 DoxX family protein [Nitrospinaceae bacterium]NIT82547.1 DoxX family protein [Nitrospinaceae bacterium]NIU44751.1 DoxX family protein [Nitrospinaceae bacterium]
MKFLKTFFHTEDSTTHLIIRLVLGGVIFLHGSQKLFGWFGGHGFGGTMGFFTEQMGMPAVIAFLVIIGESLGALGLIVGFLTRLSAAGIACIMLGAIAMVHWNNGVFMNWQGQQAGEGFEYHLLALGLAAPLILYGGGKFAMDQIIEKKFLDSA